MGQALSMKVALSDSTLMPFFQNISEPSSFSVDSRVTPDGSATNFLLQPNLNQVKELEERVEILEKNPSIVKTKICDLLIDNYRLKKPIEAILKFYPEEVLAVIPELEIFGEGNNEIEAINDLKLELVDLFDDLRDVPEEQLGEFPKSWKKIITSLIKEDKNK